MLALAAERRQALYPLGAACRGTSGTLASLDCQLMAVMQPSGGNQHASLGAVSRAEYPQTLNLLQPPSQVGTGVN